MSTLEKALTDITAIRMTGRLPTIAFLCPRCHAEADVARIPQDPPEAVVAKCLCPNCDDGEWNPMTYYDAGGRQVLLVAGEAT